MEQKIRVVMMGTPDFAIPTLKALAEAPSVEVVLVVTQPDKPVGRKRELRPTAVKQAALELGLPVEQPERVSSADYITRLDDLRPDLFVTAAYGQILSTKLLLVPRLGCLNVHASLLPRWRGAAPIHRAIMAGDNETGVTIMKTVKELDAGPVIGMESVPVSPDDNVETIHDRLAQVGAQLLIRLLPGYVAGDVVPKPQDETGITYAHRILRADEWVKFDEPVAKVHNHIRGLSPVPGAAARSDGQPVKLLGSRVPFAVQPGLPRLAEGTVYLSSEGDAYVRCADGWLELTQVQPAGKRRMSAADWLRGQRTNELHFDSLEENE